MHMDGWLPAVQPLPPGAPPPPAAKIPPGPLPAAPKLPLAEPPPAAVKMSRTNSIMRRIDLFASQTGNLLSIPVFSSQASAPLQMQRPAPTSCEREGSIPDSPTVPVRMDVIRSASTVFANQAERPPPELPLTQNLLTELWYTSKTRSSMFEHAKDASPLFGPEVMSNIERSIKIHCLARLEEYFKKKYQRTVPMKKGFQLQLTRSAEKLMQLITLKEIHVLALDPYRKRLIGAQEHLLECVKKDNVATPKGIRMSRHLETLIASTDSIPAFAKALRRILKQPHTKWIFAIFGGKHPQVQDLIGFVELLVSEMEKLRNTTVSEWKLSLEKMHEISATHRFSWTESYLSKEFGAIHSSERKIVIEDLIRHGRFLCDLYVNGTQVNGKEEGTSEELAAEVIHQLHQAGFAKGWPRERALMDAQKFLKEKPVIEEPLKPVSTEPALRLLGMRSWGRADQIIRIELKQLFQTPLQCIQKLGYRVEATITSSEEFHVVQLKDYEVFEAGTPRIGPGQRSTWWARLSFSWRVSPNDKEQTWMGELTLVDWEIHPDAPILMRYEILRILTRPR